MLQRKRCVPFRRAASGGGIKMRPRRKDIVTAIRIFYKNLTESWHLPIPFHLNHVHAATGSEAGGFLLRCRTLQKCHETVWRRSRPDDRRDYECSKITYSMERRGTGPADLSRRQDFIGQH